MFSENYARPLSETPALSQVDANSPGEGNKLMQLCAKRETGAEKKNRTVSSMLTNSL